MFPTEDSMQDDTIFQLTSKLPAPPPRPPSIASSIRSTRSSKHSSTASSLTRQSRHYDAEANEPPPTPSLAGLYTQSSMLASGKQNSPSLPSSPYFASSGMSLGEELAHAANEAGSSSLLHPASPVTTSSDKHSSSGSHRNKTVKLPSSSSSSASSTAPSGRRRNKAREGPSIVVGVRSDGQSLAQDSVSTGTTSGSGHSPSPVLSSTGLKPPRPSRSRRDSHRPPVPPATARAKIQRSCHSFLQDLLRAWLMLWSQVIWPLGVGTLRLVMAPLSGQNTVRADETAQGSSTLPQAVEPERKFAERFKHLVCTSSLLTSSLSISAYDTPPVQQQSEQGGTAVISSVAPMSISATHEVSGIVSPGNLEISAADQGSTLYMAGGAKTLLKGCLLASIMLYPLSEHRDVWMRSTLFMASVVWGLIAVFGVQMCASISYEVTHLPSGAYRPNQYDSMLRADMQSGRMSEVQRARIRKSMLAKVAGLIKSNKTFDVECNRALNAIQETELVSRGYKLSHPLPPISRIELSKPVSPPRLRGSVLSNARVVPHSAPAVGSGSGRGPRPLSLAATANTAMSSPHSSWNSSQGGDGETLRMTGLRKTLSSVFDQASGALKAATAGLVPLTDKSEMGLLREMYELEQSPSSTPVGADSGDSSFLRHSLRNAQPNPDAPRLAAAPTLDDTRSSPGRPLNRSSIQFDSSFAEKFSSPRKRDSVLDPLGNPSPSRAVSRLSYISDKSPLSGTASGPNHNPALKRLSYSSNSSTGASNTLRNSMQPVVRGIHHARRQSSLQLQFDDSRPTSPNQSMISATPDGEKIISLKAAFEGMHRIRRKVLCSLLALDFSLNEPVEIESSAIKATAQYWHVVGKAIVALSTTLSDLAESIKSEVQREMTMCGAVLREGLSNTSSIEDVAIASPNIHRDGHAVDYSGFEDRMLAMGEALRSVQIKMRLCAHDLQMRSPPPLHGEDGSVAEVGNQGHDSRSEDAKAGAEAMFATIREDLLMLSAEWESALKIMRVNGLSSANSPSTPSGAVMNNGNDGGDLATGQSSGPLLLDSPQEADEDALREWVKARSASAGDASLDSDIGVEIKRLIDRGIISTSEQDDSSDSDKKVEEDLSTLLLRSTSPQHLPPPGLEKVYEDVAEPEPRAPHSHLTREERIRLVKEQRAAAGAQQNSKHAAPIEMTSGMLQELTSVMQNRKATIVDGEHRPSPPEDMRYKPASLNDDVERVSNGWPAATMGGPPSLQRKPAKTGERPQHLAKRSNSAGFSSPANNKSGHRSATGTPTGDLVAGPMQSQTSESFGSFAY